MELIINGEWRTVDARTVGEMVRLLGLTERPIIIEQNGTIIAKELWASTPLEAGAKIEIVQFIGGG